MDLETLSSGFALSLQARMLGEFFEPRPEGNISLSWLEVGVAASLLLVNAVISLKLGLGIAKRIGTSAIRMTINWPFLDWY